MFAVWGASAEPAIYSPRHVVAIFRRILVHDFAILTTAAYPNPYDCPPSRSAGVLVNAGPLSSLSQSA